MTESQSFSPSKLSHQRVFCLYCRTGQYFTKLVCRKLDVPALSFMGPSLLPIQTNQAKVPELQPGGQNATRGFFPVNSPLLLHCSHLLSGQLRARASFQSVQRLQGSSWPSPHCHPHTPLTLCQTLVEKFQRSAMLLFCLPKAKQG